MRDASRRYRNWASESAALDPALRQAGRSLAEQVGRELRPLNYVVSMRLGSFDSSEPETSEKMLRVLERYPSTLQARPHQHLVGRADRGAGWPPARSTCSTWKGQYKGTPVDVEIDPVLYAKLIEAFPRSGW